MQKNKSNPYTILENDFVINMGALQPRLKNISVNKETLFFYVSVRKEKKFTNWQKLLDVGS